MLTASIHACLCNLSCTAYLTDATSLVSHLRPQGNEPAMHSRLVRPCKCRSTSDTHLYVSWCFFFQQLCMFLQHCITVCILSPCDIFYSPIHSGQQMEASWNGRPLPSDEQVSCDALLCTCCCHCCCMGALHTSTRQLQDTKSVDDWLNLGHSCSHNKITCDSAI